MVADRFAPHPPPARRVEKIEGIQNSMPGRLADRIGDIVRCYSRGRIQCPLAPSLDLNDNEILIRSNAQALPGSQNSSQISPPAPVTEARPLASDIVAAGLVKLIDALDRQHRAIP